MIDPRMIRPEAVPPNTDIVTPSPQYYGQGQVVGGQIQLGDVYGRLPSQSQEEYMYGNLANIANAAMGLAQIPGQLEQAQRRRDQRHDQDAINAYQVELNKVEQASLNGESLYNYNNNEYPINRPEGKSQLELDIQERMLGNLITSGGKAEASRLKTSILAQRNQNVDGRLNELFLEYQKEVDRFNRDNPLLNPAAMDIAFRSDPKINDLVTQINSYRDTKSTAMEQIQLGIFKNNSSYSRGANSYLLEQATKGWKDSMSTVVDVLPEFVALSTNGDINTIFPSFQQLVGDMPNADQFFQAIGFADGDIVNGSIIDSIVDNPTANNLNRLVQAIADHSLQFVPNLTPEERESQIRAFVSSVEGPIVKIASKETERRLQQERYATVLGRSMELNEYASNPEGAKYIPPTELYIGTTEKDAVDGMRGLLTRPPENEYKPLPFVISLTSAYWDDNLGYRGMPLSSSQVRVAELHFQTSKENLVERGLYTEENGIYFLTEKGMSYQQSKKNEMLSTVVQSREYQTIYQNTLSNLIGDTHILASANVDQAADRINASLIRITRELFPFDQSVSDADIVDTLGLGDQIKLPSQKVLGIMGDSSSTIQTKVRAVLSAFDNRQANSGASRDVINRWINTEDPLKNPMMRYEALDFLKRYKENPDSLDDFLGDLLRSGHNEASATKLYQTALDIEYRTQTGNMFTKQLVGWGLVSPNITISSEELFNFDKSSIADVRNLWEDPNLFNKEAGQLTQKGAVAWAYLSNDLIYGPTVDENKINRMESFLISVADAERSFGDEPDMIGTPLTFLTAFIGVGEMVANEGISLRDNAAFQLNLSDTMIGRPASSNIVDLTYDPSVRYQDRFTRIFNNPNEKTDNISLAFSLNVAKQLRALKNVSPEDKKRILRETSFGFTTRFAIAGDDKASLNNIRNSNFTSAMPEIRPNGNDLNAMEAARLYRSSLQDRDDLNIETPLGLLVSITNTRAPRSEQIVINDDNRGQLSLDTTIGMLNLLKRANHNITIRVPEGVADAWNASSLNESDTILPGTVIPLWANDPNVISLNKILQSYRNPENQSRLAEFGSNGSDQDQLEMMKILLDNFDAFASETTPGRSDNFAFTLGFLAYANEQGYIPPEQGLSYSDRFEKIADEFLLSNVTRPVGPYWSYRSTNMRGGFDQTKSLNVPPPYLNKNGRPSWNFPNNLLQDSNGKHVFANDKHQIAGLFFNSRPKLSFNPEQYSKNRLEFIKTGIPGFGATWNQLSDKTKDTIQTLAFSDITLIDFMRGASYLANKEVPSFANPRYPDFTYNSGNLEDNDLRRAFDQGGWGLVEIPRDPYGFQRNNEGAFIIRNNGSNQELPLSGDLMAFIDLRSVANSIVNPRTPKEMRDLERVAIGMGGLYGALTYQTAPIFNGRKEVKPIDPKRRTADLPKNVIKVIEEKLGEDYLPSEESSGGGFFDGEKTIPLSSNTASGGSLGTLGSAAAMLSQTTMALPPQRDVAKLIIGEEGFISKPRKATKTEQYLTVGHGHRLDGSSRSRAAFKKALPDKNYDEFMKGKGSITKEEALRLFETDVPDYIKRAREFTNHEYIYNKKTQQRPKGGKLGGLTFDDHSDELQKYIISTTFRGSWGKSPKTRRLLSEGKYEEAAKEFLNNDEYRTAVEDGRRGIRKRMEDVAKAIRDEAKRKRS